MSNTGSCDGLMAILETLTLLKTLEKILWEIKEVEQKAV